MAGDKGAEVPKATKEYLKKPDKPNLKAAQKDFYSKRNVRISPAFSEAVRKARKSTGTQGSEANINNPPASENGEEYQTMPGADKKTEEVLDYYKEEGGQEGAEEKPKQSQRQQDWEQREIDNRKRAAAERTRLNGVFRNMSREDMAKVQQEFGTRGPKESERESGIRFDNAIKKVAASIGTAETQTTQSEE